MLITISDIDMAASKTITRTHTYPVGRQDNREATKRHMPHISARHEQDSHTINSTEYRVDPSKPFVKSDVINKHNHILRQLKTQKGVKRTDSYKLATNRHRSIEVLDDNVNGVIGDTVGHDRNIRTDIKYNTMPNRIQVGDPLTTLENNTRDFPGRDKTHHVPLKSPKSENQLPSMSHMHNQPINTEQKSKSVWKRIKERFIQTISRKSKPLESNSERVHDNTGVQVRISQTYGNKHTHKDERTVTIESSITVVSESTECCTVSSVAGEAYATKQRDHTNVQSMNIGPVQQEGSKKGPAIYTTDVDHGVLLSDPVDIPQSKYNSHKPSMRSAGASHGVVADDDGISEIFGSLIDPTTPFLSIPNRTRPDKSNLTLDGLQKYRPKSVERKSERRMTQGYDSRDNMSYSVSPAIHSGGHLWTDSPILSESSPLGVYDGVNIPFTEQQRRLYDYGRRFAAIGDRLVADRDHQTNNRSSEDANLTSHERSIIHELKKYTDMRNADMLQKGGLNVSILPIIERLVTAPDYTGFEQIIAQELSHTIRWQQVAWYTYLIKTTMCVVGTGQTLGKNVSNYATRYFNTYIRPWIESRPNGWESFHDEGLAIESDELEDSEVD